MTTPLASFPESDGLPAATVVSGDRTFATPSAPVRNPARHAEVVGTVALATEDVVNDVVRFAEEAGRRWGALTMRERAADLRRAADAVATDTENRARLLTLEQGKVLWESQVDVSGGAHLLRYYADLVENHDDESLVEDDRGITIVLRKPMGVTTLIVPWNYPIYLCFMGLAPALAAGNAVIVKPSELAPLALTDALSRAAAALPPGVLNVVPGAGDTGSALVRHPRVRKVIFTGGTDTGRHVLRDAAGSITSVSLELGGNDPGIILDSASINDDLVREIRRSVFTCTGQVCFNIKRLYVASRHYADFLGRFRDAVDEISVGDGLDPRSTIGPLNNAKQFASVAALRDATVAGGSRVDVLGRAVEGTDWGGGYYMKPMVVSGIAKDAPLVSREQFGPLIPVLPFEDEDSAVAWANDSEFGLAASVWSEDIPHALAVARRIHAGSVFVNSHRIGSSDQTMPFGGMKQSGLGRNHGMWAIDECSELQAIAHRPNTSKFPGPR